MHFDEYLLAHACEARGRRSIVRAVGHVAIAFGIVAVCTLFVGRLSVAAVRPPPLGKPPPRLDRITQPPTGGGCNIDGWMAERRS